MAGLQDIRRRIRSVKNTQQVTKAMKMISAVKLRKSQERLIAMRPYATKLVEVVRNVVGRLQQDEKAPNSPLAQAFLAPREEQRIRVLVVASEATANGITVPDVGQHRLELITLHALARDLPREQPIDVTDGRQLPDLFLIGRADSHVADNQTLVSNHVMTFPSLLSIGPNTRLV